MHRIDLPCAEAKTPSNIATFPRSDLVKLGQEMRWMVNRLIAEGVHRPVVGGILISGFNMTIYKTYKILQYASDKPGIYIMVEQSRMALFKTMDELSFVPVIVSDSRQLKDITLDTAIKAKDYLRERSPGVMPTTYKPPLSWLRSGFYELDIYNQQKVERGPVTAISNK